MPPTLPRQRRKRDPESTRMSILEAATTILAQDGAEGLSVSSVAKLAGVNRGTAYQHFQVKEDLIRATLDRVSQQLLDAVFESEDPEGQQPAALPQPDPVHLPDVIESMAIFNQRMAEYAVENPDIGRIWLYDVLSRKNPKDDAFFKRFEVALKDLAMTDATYQDMDTEVLAVLMLTGYFLWPVWVRSHAGTKKERKVMAQRFATELTRLSVRGVFQEANPELLTQ